MAAALDVKLSAQKPAYLALAGYLGEEPRVQRLLIVSSDRSVVYDEILSSDRYLKLLKARRPDGAETLLIGADGLKALRPLDL